MLVSSVRHPILVSGYGQLFSDDASERKGWLVRIKEDVLKSVVYVGTYNKSNGFCPVGTGFICSRNSRGINWPHIVTNKHVVDTISGDRVYIRVNRNSGGFEVFEHLKDGLVYHPEKEIDLVAMASNLSFDKYDILMIPVDMKVLDREAMALEQIRVGENVFSVGLFTNHYGQIDNTPVARFGNLSAMPVEKVRTEYGYVSAFLVELRSIAGISGSPVWVQLPPYRIADDGSVVMAKNSTYFLGVMQGRFLSTDPTDSKSVSSDMPGENNTGIGVVIPAQKVLELLDHPTLEKLRESHVQEEAKKSGYRSSSVVSVKDDPKDGSGMAGDDILSKMLDTPPDPKK